VARGIGLNALHKAERVAERQFRRVIGHRLISSAAVLDGQCRFQEIDCETSRGRVAHESREYDHLKKAFTEFLQAQRH
jgi:hypothetical protein